MSWTAELGWRGLGLTTLNMSATRSALLRFFYISHTLVRLSSCRTAGPVRHAHLDLSFFLSHRFRHEPRLLVRRRGGPKQQQRPLLSLLFFPQRLPFWVSFLPVREWWRCNAGNPKSHPLCPPDFGLLVGFLVLCWPKRKETRPSKILQQNKNSKTSEKLTCTCSPNPQKSKNIKITTQNPPKIDQNHQKSIKIY